MKYIKFYMFLYFIFSGVCICQEDDNSKSDCNQEIDSTIQSYLNEKSRIYTLLEYGGGDAFGVVKTLKVVDKNITITFDNLDSGEYGFTHKIYILENDSLLFVKYKIKEWEFTKNSSKYVLEEIIYDLSKNYIMKYHRKKETEDYSNEDINNDYKCEIVQNAKALISKELKDYKDIDNYENYHDK